MYTNEEQEVEALKKQLSRMRMTAETFEGVDFIVSRIETLPKRTYIELLGSPIKSYFFHILDPRFNVINCNSSLERFKEDMKNYDPALTIFNNINLCKDKEILDVVYMTNNILLH